MNLDQQIVTGAKGPNPVGLVARDLNQSVQVPIVRRIQLTEGQVEFHSTHRRYRVEFQKPKQQLDQATGEVIQEGPRYLQFEGFRCVTDNPVLIHQAMGCQNIPGMMVDHEHTKQCPPKCQGQKCALNHVNPLNPTQKYYLKHPNYGLTMSFWDAAIMAKKIEADQKENFRTQARQVLSTISAEEMPEFLAATGLDRFQIAPKESKK